MKTHFVHWVEKEKYFWRVYEETILKKNKATVFCFSWLKALLLGSLGLLHQFLCQFESQPKMTWFQCIQLCLSVSVVRLYYSPLTHIPFPHKLPLYSSLLTLNKSLVNFFLVQPPCLSLLKFYFWFILGS